MREILFRGKRTYNGDWIEGSFWLDIDKPTIITPANHIGKLVIPQTVGQYTGLKDKNGKQIFEGDIVEAKLKEGVHEGFSWGNQTVVFKDCAFCIMDSRGQTTPLCSYAPTVEFEVIGNIHDNPELLEDT